LAFLGYGQSTLTDTALVDELLGRLAAERLVRLALAVGAVDVEVRETLEEVGGDGA
jgi:hypothetical protein